MVLCHRVLASQIIHLLSLIVELGFDPETEVVDFLEVGVLAD